MLVSFLRVFILLKLVFFSLSSYALKSKPIFPIAIKDQISSADGVIIATFQGSSNTKNREGNVTTVGSFFIEKVAGIPEKKILNRYSFRVEYPGGDWQGIKYKVKESPSFEEGEKVVLILKKGKFGYELPYQALSKFNFKKRDGELYIYSKYFKEKNGVGVISWNEFNKIVEQHFGMRVGSYFNNKINTSSSQLKHGKNNRHPAAVYQSESDNSEYKVETSWLVFILGALGGLFSLFGKYQEEQE